MSSYHSFPKNIVRYFIDISIIISTVLTTFTISQKYLEFFYQNLDFRIKALFLEHTFTFLMQQLS